MDVMTMENKMKVDIWADVMCPFCYLGKRKFEAALKLFSHKNEVEVIWHSFQLDPTLKPRPGEDLYSYLAQIKGQSRGWSMKFNKQIAATAKKAGLVYDFDKVVVSNTFDAHRLIHQAKKSGLGSKAEERLFRAYFTEGMDIGNHKVLVVLGVEVGLDPKEVKKMLESDACADAVRKDEDEAQKMGVGGVPFFLLNNKYTIVGAQEPDLFLEALEKSFSGWKPARRETRKRRTPRG